MLQNIHRYFFWLSLPILAFLWWDAILAFNFNGRFGIGVGTLVLIINATLLSLYSLSCHSCRHLCGGHLDVFSSPGQVQPVADDHAPQRAAHAVRLDQPGCGSVQRYLRPSLSMGVIRDFRLL